MSEITLCTSASTLLPEGVAVAVGPVAVLPAAVGVGMTIGVGVTAAEVAVRTLTGVDVRAGVAVGPPAVGVGSSPSVIVVSLESPQPATTVSATSAIATTNVWR
jgi:hypothetical protein